MKYLERLKQQISPNAREGEATKGTKGASVPFVAPYPAPSRQIQAVEMKPERQRLVTQAVEMLRDRPGDTRAVVGAPHADGRCLVAVALRHPDGTIGTALLDALIDPFALLDLAKRHSVAFH